ncbi:MAG: DUF4396 domain-containing protein [Alphaproteobacteria bacterium]|nr:DUF4396 domain-containing protein [Alphaproteobacteria bacterium]
MIPQWLHDLSLISLAVGAIAAVVLAIDVARHPQKMWIMNLVWPVNALFSPLGVAWLYAKFGRNIPQGDHAKRSAPFAVQVAKAAGHCGSGCTLGDIIAESLAVTFPGIAVWFGLGALFAEPMFAIWILDFIFAFAIGIAFQYFTIQPMRHLAPLDGLKQALKADVLSLSAWQIGMYGFMAIAQFALFRPLFGVSLKADMPEFWFMMQIAMNAGFATSYPVNWLLLKAGVKEAM